MASPILFIFIQALNVDACRVFDEKKERTIVSWSAMISYNAWTSRGNFETLSEDGSSRHEVE